MTASIPLLGIIWLTNQIAKFRKVFHLASSEDFELVNSDAILSGVVNEGFLVQIRDDSVLEDNETFSLTLLTIDFDVVIFQEESTQIEILNDDGKYLYWALNLGTKSCQRCSTIFMDQKIEKALIDCWC